MGAGALWTKRGHGSPKTGLDASRTTKSRSHQATHARASGYAVAEHVALSKAAKRAWNDTEVAASDLRGQRQATLTELLRPRQEAAAELRKKTETAAELRKKEEAAEAARDKLALHRPTPVELAHRKKVSAAKLPGPAAVESLNWQEEETADLLRHLPLVGLDPEDPGTDAANKYSELHGLDEVS